MSHTTLLIPILAATLAGGCDKAEPTEAEAAAGQDNYTIKADDLDLELTLALIERSDVRDAESVEALLNAEDAQIQLDVDGDGQRDFISVREDLERRGTPSNDEAELVSPGPGPDPSPRVDVVVKDGATARFELRVVPSSTIVVAEFGAEPPSVLVATLDFEVDVQAESVVVEASYAPVVIVAEHSEVERVVVHHVQIHEHHDAHIVVAAPFVAWVWLGARPIYVGHHHLPPGHAKHLGLAWHHGPRRHDHGHGHGGHHGGPSKTKVKAKSQGGSGKAKSKGGHGKSR